MRSSKWKTADLIFLTILLLSAFPIRAAAMATRQDVMKLLNSPFQKMLFHNTYESLLHRLAPDGYLPESLTGAYGGMFPRTVGPYVFLMLEEHQWGVARRILQFTLEATRLSHLHRVPHVIGGAGHVMLVPQVDSADPGQTLHSIVLYNLLSPNYGGAQPFQAKGGRLYGADMWISAHAKGKLRVEIVRSPTAQHPLAVATISVSRMRASEGWVRVLFKKPVLLRKGVVYDLRLRFAGKGRVKWWGINHVRENSYGGSYSYDKPPLGWRLHPGYLTAFALNYGALKYKRQMVIPGFSNVSQPDGQYSVILAWARYIHTTHDTAFENETYRQVARLTDQATRTPYLNDGWGTTTTNLVRNPCFEHSRQDRYWDTYDLLTQVFTAEAWREMIPIARARGDWAHVVRWQRALKKLQHGIRYYLTRRLGGKTIYAEMRIPNSRGGKIYTGLSWVNLSPIAAGWKGVNPKILKATVAAYWKRAMFTWDGFHILGFQWNPPSRIAHIPVRKKYGWVWISKRIRRPTRIGRSLSGKEWAWAFVYSVQQQQWGRACHMLEFLRKANAAALVLQSLHRMHVNVRKFLRKGGLSKLPILAESFWFRPDGKIYLSDPGNGEQCSWYCWAIATARNILAAHKPGLSPLIFRSKPPTP